MDGVRTSPKLILPRPLKWQHRWGARVIASLIRLIGWTIRFEFHNHSGRLEETTFQPVILAAWHNRLALSPIIYRCWVRRRQPQARMAALVSASRDGGMLASILEQFGAQPVRGSSSRRGGQAMLEMTSWAKRGLDLAITPDGPRGPCYVVQDGVVVLAQLTGLDIVSVSVDLSWKVCLKSWDRFQVPLPFSRCRIILDPAINVPPEASAEEREQLRQQLERQMRARAEG